MTRKEFFRLTGSTLMAAAGGVAAPARRPNIVFILADDLGYGDLTCYGQTRIQTPNISRLAAEGMRFTSAYAGSTVCAPSRCCLMTGFHTGHATTRGNKPIDLPLKPDQPIIPEVLKKAGYRTGTGRQVVARATWFQRLSHAQGLRRLVRLLQPIARARILSRTLARQRKSVPVQG